jgi:hypothetical protein
VRAVREDGTPIDGGQTFSPLAADVSFDMW